MDSVFVGDSDEDGVSDVVRDTESVNELVKVLLAERDNETVGDLEGDSEIDPV